MSLDVSLEGATATVPCVCPNCGNEHTCQRTETVFDANITHNLGKMADEAGIYMHLWRPDELGIKQAGEIIEPLRQGIQRMKADPAHFEQFSSPNGWGMYENFVPWVERYLAACEQYPDATIYVSR
jgi:hypothetical protein